MSVVDATGTQLTHIELKGQNMGLLRGAVAGAAAWKWGGGIIGTILVFILAYWVLGIVFN